MIFQVSLSLLLVAGNLFSPSHLFSLRFPSVPLLSSNPIYLRNRRVDGLLAQVLGTWFDMWGLGYFCLRMQVYIYIFASTRVFLCVFLKHNLRGSVVVFLHGSGEQT